MGKIEFLRNWLSQKIIWKAIGLFCLFVLITTVNFVERTRCTYSANAKGLTGVVFTGQFSRVNAALQLLNEQKLNRLFISGVNQGAGMHATNFAEQFKLSTKLSSDLKSGVLALGENANNTLENAKETDNWLKNTGNTDKTMVLITSKWHMPRASLALEKTVKNRKILRYSVSEENSDFNDIITEYFKYLITTMNLNTSVLN